jgi:hypothetical protein
MAINKETKHWILAIIIMMILVIVIDLLVNHRH